MTLVDSGFRSLVTMLQDDVQQVKKSVPMYGVRALVILAAVALAGAAYRQVSLVVSCLACPCSAICPQSFSIRSGGKRDDAATVRHPRRLCNRLRRIANMGEHTVRNSINQCRMHVLVQCGLRRFSAIHASSSSLHGTATVLCF